MDFILKREEHCEEIMMIDISRSQPFELKNNINEYFLKSQENYIFKNDVLSITFFQMMSFLCHLPMLKSNNKKFINHYDYQHEIEYIKFSIDTKDNNEYLCQKWVPRKIANNVIWYESYDNIRYYNPLFNTDIQISKITKSFNELLNKICIENNISFVDNDRINFYFNIELLFNKSNEKIKERFLNRMSKFFNEKTVDSMIRSAMSTAKTHDKTMQSMETILIRKIKKIIYSMDFDEIIKLINKKESDGIFYLEQISNIHNLFFNKIPIVYPKRKDKSSLILNKNVLDLYCNGEEDAKLV